MQKKLVMILMSLLVMKPHLYSNFLYMNDFQKPKALCVGNIIFPESVKPYLSLYYKGDKLQPDVDGSHEVDRVPFSLVEDKSTQQIHILIAQQVRCSTSDNTVQYLHVPQGQGYKFYTLLAARDYDQNGEMRGYMWDIKEQSLGHKGVAPDNTMIFLFDASLVDGLEVRSWVQDNNTRLLPDIVIKKNITADMLHRAVAVSRLAAMDMDMLHHSSEMKKQRNNQAIAMMVL